MKRLLLSLAVVVGFVAVSRAGTPQDINERNGPYSNLSFFGSTTTSSGNTTVTLPAIANKNYVPVRYCFDWILVQSSTSQVVSIVDNSTTIAGSNGIVINGAGTAVPVTFQSAHLEPLCFGPGDSANIVITGSASGTVSWAGFTVAGGAGGSTSNSGL